MTSLDKNLAKGKRFAFSSSAHGADKFAVVTMNGFEAISKNFSFDLILVSDDDKIDFADMLSNPAKFEIFSPDGNSSTLYHGVLSEFEQLHMAGLHVFYRAVLAPKMQRLEQYRTSEVYLNDQTIPAILETVLKHGGLKPGDFEKKVRGTYRERSFVCQYQETDFAFVTRWMEKEGIYYYFDHSGQAEKLVFIDESSAQPAEVLKLNYVLQASTLDDSDIDSVQSFVCRQKPLPKQVILQGFNYLDAKAHTLKETAQVSDKGTGDVMLYGENFLNSKEGERYAKLRAQEIACSGKVFLGAATAVGLRSGYFMELAGHYRSDMNGKYLVTEVEHEGSQAGVLLAGIAHSFGGTSGETSYSCRFRAIPSGVQYRPERLAIRPHVAGSMSAIVDAEGDGKYAEMDELGQYKVQLPFSTTGKGANKGSARVRMATPYSGHGYGMHFPLHKGAEVLLSFIDGDPDQPVIMNAAPNSENLSVVNNKNASVDLLKTAGGNSLEFEDKKSEERVSFYSPTFDTTWRIGAMATKTAPVDVNGTWTHWGGNQDGIHGVTKANLGLDVAQSMVAKVGATTQLPLHKPKSGELQLHALSGLICIDNKQYATVGGKPTPETKDGALDIYARHINMFAEPEFEDGAAKRYKYTLMTSSTKDSDADAPWGFKQLYELQKFDDSTDLTKLKESNGTKEVSASNKTSYTKGDSNSATFGDSASVTHGNSYKLTRGVDFSHSYGLSNAVYFGMKNDVFVGGKTSLSVALSAGFSLGAELKTSVGATMELSLGAKTGVAVAVDSTIKATSIKAAGVELKTKVTELKTKVTELKNSVSDIITSSTAIDFSGLHIVL